jgi:hypothetical protein
MEDSYLKFELSEVGDELLAIMSSMGRLETSFLIGGPGAGSGEAGMVVRAACLGTLATGSGNSDTLK